MKAQVFVAALLPHRTGAHSEELPQVQNGAYVGLVVGLRM